VKVVVDPTAQGQGIAHAMIDTVLENARRQGFEYVEAQWRVTNDQREFVLAALRTHSDVRTTRSRTRSREVTTRWR